MKIYKNIKIVKTKTRFPLSHYSDKHRFFGQPFETVSKTFKNLEEAKKEAQNIVEHGKKMFKGFVPYLVLAVSKFGEVDIFCHRWAMINEKTRELTENY